MTAAQPSLAKLQPNPHWARLPLFDRKGWKTVRFGEVVENLNETCDPAEAGLERVVAMEHLEPGSLHVREWGKVADGTTFTRRCRPGQVLFGKRRAYQRKVAVTEFDAVVSGDIYVLAPKGDRLVAELLPFLCLSERFFQHAVGTSAGSLSPRTNWSSLASFEFALPPLDQQRRIAEILGALNETARTVSALVENLREAKTAQFKASISARDVAGKREFRELQSLLIEGRNISYGIVQPGTHDPNGVRLIKSQQVRDDSFDLSEDFRITKNLAEEYARTRLQGGEILLNLVGASIGRSAIAPTELRGANVVRAIAVIPVRHEFARWIQYNLQGPVGQQLLRSKSPGSAQPTLNLSEVKTLRIPFPALREQHAIVNQLDRFGEAIASAVKHSAAISTVRGAIIEGIFHA
jgi:type I restriction enzyme S subunit